MTTAAFGKLQEFNPDAETLEQVQAYLDANGIVDDKHSAILVSTIGSKAYAILRSTLPNLTRIWWRC